MNKIDKAIEVLRKGGIIIFPTDTAFGIGCRMDDEKAVRRLFKIRRRPENQAFSVLTSSIEMTERYLKPLSHGVLELMKEYWPGAITLILQCIKEKVPGDVRAGGNTLGVRMPNNKIILSIIEGAGVPILGPSANFHGEKTPYYFKDLDPKLVKLVDYVVPGERVSRRKRINTASTVINCAQIPWEVIRQGVIELKL